MEDVKHPVPDQFEDSRPLDDIVEITPAESTRIRRLLDSRLLPLMLVVYFLQQLDKSALSYASVFGFVAQTHLVGSQYSWLSSIVYVAQAVSQPIVAYMLVKLPIGPFLAFSVLAWGIIMCGMVGARDFGSLLAVRFLLGVAEAGVAPAFVALVSAFYRRLEQTNRVAAWYSMNGITAIIGPILTFGIGHIQTSALRPYQWIFLIIGLLTLVLAVPCFLFMPSHPSTARILSPGDRGLAVERVRANQQGNISRDWRWTQVWECLLDVKTWLWFAMIFCAATISGGINAFGPLIINGFGYDQFATILLQTPFGAFLLVSTLAGAYLNTVFKAKGPILSIFCLPCLGGMIALYKLPRGTSSDASLLVAYYFVAFYSAFFTDDLLLECAEYGWRDEEEDDDSNVVHRSVGWQHPRSTAVPNH